MRFTLADEANMLLVERKSLQKRALRRDQGVLDTVGREMILDDTVFDLNGTKYVEVPFNVLPYDLLNKNEVAYTLLLVD